MIARWGQGRSTVDQLVETHRIERVAPSREVADLMLAQARQHLATASVVAATDPTAGFQVAYDAARKPSRPSWPTKDCVHVARAPMRFC